MTWTVLLAVVGACVVLVALRRTLRRFELASISDQPAIVPLVLLPTLLGLTLFTATGATVALVVMAVLAALTGGLKAVEGQWSGTLLVTLLLAFGIPIIHSPSLDRLLIGLATLAIIVLSVRSRPFDAVIASVVDGIGLFLIINVVAHLAGIENPSASARTAGLESTSGGERIFYPLSASLAVPPLMAAAFIAALVLCFEGAGWRRSFRGAALICAAVIITGANTRVALVLAVLISLGVIVAPLLLSRMAVPTVVLSLAFPFVFPVIFGPLIRPVITTITSVVPFLSRGDQLNDQGFAGRDRIWALALEYWQLHADAFYALVGWGFQGQRVSGASSVYGPQFLGLSSDPRMLTVHSSSLQQLFDAGIIGLAALVAAVIITLRTLAKGTRNGSRAHLIGLGVAATLALGGTTEVTMSPGFAQEPFWAFVAVALAVARHGSARVDEPAPEPRPAGRSRTTR